jgi:iron complex transport system substrate-binding protein
MTRIFILLLLISLSFCTTPEKSTEAIQNKLSYAGGFELVSYGNYKRITVSKPWQKSQGESYSYILTDNPANVPDSLKSGVVIKTPVERVIVFSTTHVGFISALGKSSSIVGVSGRDFICDSVVRSSLENKKCMDIGFAPNIDFEQILLLKPDLVFLYGLDPSVTSLVKRLKEAGIQSVLVSEFLEDHPLGKAEWIRFFSAFYSCEAYADSVFEEVKNNYLSLKDSASVMKTIPSILVGLPFKDTWFMAGGKSFTSKFIEDAGGNYLWKENSSTEYIPLDLESVFQKAINADIWINTGTAESMNAVLSFDPRFQYVPAFQKGRVFNNNLKINSTGGNDFWESGAVRPDRVLNDLINIFHPEKPVSDLYYYYRKL